MLNLKGGGYRRLEGGGKEGERRFEERREEREKTMDVRSKKERSNSKGEGGERMERRLWRKGGVREGKTMEEKRREKRRKRCSFCSQHYIVYVDINVMALTFNHHLQKDVYHIYGFECARQAGVGRTAW